MKMPKAASPVLFQDCCAALIVKKGLYYSGMGILHELTPEEMEEVFQQYLTERSKEKQHNRKVTPSKEIY